MATSAESPSKDVGALSAVHRFVARIEDVLNALAAIAIFTLMFFMLAEVIGRGIFNAPIPGAIDWIEVSMATFAFLGAAYCQRYGGHVRMEVVISRMRGRLLWGIEAFATTISLFYIVVIVEKSFLHFRRSWTIGDSTIDVQLPLWPSKLIVPIALSVLALRLAIQLWGYIRLAIDPEKVPVAVPVVMSVAEHAREEIHEVLHDDDQPEDSRAARRPGEARPPHGKGD